MINLDSYKTLSILGDRHTGKTNLMFWLADNYKGDRNIVFYGYPKRTKYTNIYSLEDLSRTTDSIIFMDELQNHIKLYDKKANNHFLDLLSTMAHNNNTVIFSTPLSQYIAKALDNFIDAYIYTSIGDLGSLKNGSGAKRMLKKVSFPFINPWSCNIPIGNFLFVSQFLKDCFQFTNMDIGKDWRCFVRDFVRDEKRDFSEKKEE